MRERNHQIIDAALRVFSQYGYAKTTMNDIAREAGVARQTLYNAYAGKEDVQRAVIRSSLESTYDSMLAGWADLDDFGAKLDIFFELGPVKWFDWVASSPQAAEMMEGLHKTSKEEMECFSSHVVQAIAEQLEVHSKAITAQGHTAIELAEFIYSCAANAKHNAADREKMLQRLAILKTTIMHFIGAKNT